MSSVIQFRETAVSAKASARPDCTASRPALAESTCTVFVMPSSLA